MQFSIIRPARLILLAVVVLAALSLAACGGSSSSTSAGSTASLSTSTSSGTTTGKHGGKHNKVGMRCVVAKPGLVHAPSPLDQQRVDLLLRQVRTAPV